MYDITDHPMYLATMMAEDVFGYLQDNYPDRTDLIRDWLIQTFDSDENGIEPKSGDLDEDAEDDEEKVDNSSRLNEATIGMAAVFEVFNIQNPDFLDILGSTMMKPEDISAILQANSAFRSRNKIIERIRTPKIPTYQSSLTALIEWLASFNMHPDALEQAAIAAYRLAERIYSLHIQLQHEGEG